MSRYIPSRERDRTPPRYASNSWTPRGDRSNDFGRNDIPRGPRQADTPTRAPSAPRGRGGFRDSDRMTDRWRDEDRFGRGRTPPRRGSREFPKPIDTERARRDSREGLREGPPSAGSNLSDAPRNNSYRGGFGRGRGEFRGRGYQGDDRNTFRPRSRSRGPRRDRSVDSREDFRERPSDPDDRRFYRDREERDGSYFRPGQNSRPDVRPSVHGGPSTALSTTQNERPPPLQDRSTRDPRREHDLSRRGSSLSENIASKDARRDVERYDLINGRPDPVRPPRPTSPPPSAPQVPAFGSFRPNFVNHQINSTPSSISWVNPNLQKAPLASSQSLKGPPTAPRALAAVSQPALAHPPTAPKADRVFDQPRPVPNSSILHDTGSKEITQASRQAISPSLKSSKSLGDTPQNVSTPTAPARDMATASTVKHLAPPSAPRAMTRAPSPNPSSTTWARTNVPHTSPRLLQGNIPTGPKADRIAPQALRTQPPPSKSYRATSQTYTERAPIVPSKRESNGQERERRSTSEPRTDDAQPLGEAVVDLDSEPHQISPPITQNMNDTVNNSLNPLPEKSEEPHDVEMAESAIHTRAEESPAGPRNIPESLHDLSEDDDELDVKDFLVQMESKFNKDKARLLAKMVDLSAEEFCPSSLLEAAARLASIKLVASALEYKPPQVDERKSVKQELVVELDTTESPIAVEGGNDGVDVDMEDDDSSRESSVFRMSTPDLDALPYLEKGPPTPLSDPDPFCNTLYGTIAEQDIKARLQSTYVGDDTEQEAARKYYRDIYMPWKRHILNMDRLKENQPGGGEEEAEAEEVPSFLLVLTRKWARSMEAPLRWLLTLVDLAEPLLHNGQKMPKESKDLNLQPLGGNPELRD
ncbi:hypothetical protein EJ08DRAFT_454416 [Tothia fuscella]|uniref:Uncharacterized protein n=1 Tax=Tothia fuscella TaxID=1048955 RepID=A0A9P4NIW6_9PEZI|nr:hypothetical protein EJ08DRAFT_454416 [Tothia fuscella]